MPRRQLANIRDFPAAEAIRREPVDTINLSNEELQQIFIELVPQLRTGDACLKMLGVDFPNARLKLAYPAPPLMMSRSEAIFDVNLSEAMIFLVVPDNGNHQIIACSNAFINYYKLKREAVVGKRIDILNHVLTSWNVPHENGQEQAVLTLMQMNGIMATEEIYQLPDEKVHAIRKEDNQPIKVHITSQSLFYEDGKFLGTIVEHQITEMSRYEPLTSPSPLEFLMMVKERAQLLKDFLARFEEAARMLLPEPATDRPRMPHQKRKSVALREFEKRLAAVTTEQDAHGVYKNFLAAMVSKKKTVAELTEVLKTVLEQEAIVKKGFKPLLENYDGESTIGIKHSVLGQQYDQVRYRDKEGVQRTAQITPQRGKSK